MRKHHAFRLARGSGGKDERSDALRVRALRQQRDALIFSLLVRQRKDFRVGPQASQSLCQQPFAQLRMFFEHGFTAGTMNAARQVVPIQAAAIAERAAALGTWSSFNLLWTK